MDQRLVLSPAAARLLASMSRQIAERLPTDASDTTGDLDQQPSATAGHENNADASLASEQPRVTCSSAVLDTPAPVAAIGERPAWQAQRDAVNELAVSAATLRLLHIQIGSLVKVGSVCGLSCALHAVQGMRHELVDYALASQNSNRTAIKRMVAPHSAHVIAGLECCCHGCTRPPGEAHRTC